MKLINKSLHQLKHNRVLAVLEIMGKNGERISLTEQGVLGRAIFFHELPRSNCDCSYVADDNSITLGGSERESERSIYLIMEPLGMMRDEMLSNTAERL